MLTGRLARSRSLTRVSVSPTVPPTSSAFSGTSNVTVAAPDAAGASGSASLTWPIGNRATGGCAYQVSYAEVQCGGSTVDTTVTGARAGTTNSWTLTRSFPGDQIVTNTWNARGRPDRHDGDRGEPVPQRDHRPAATSSSPSSALERPTTANPPPSPSTATRATDPLPRTGPALAPRQAPAARRPIPTTQEPLS